MEHKFCSKCKDNKSADEFYKDKNNPDGLSGNCKQCRKEWKIKNRENLLGYATVYNSIYFNKPEAKESRRMRSVEWRKNNPERQRQYIAENKEIINKNKRNSVAKRIKEDPSARLAKNLRNRLRCILKGKIKKGSAIDDLGCSMVFLKNYLESKFLLNMTWANYGKGDGKWQLDHIIPLFTFDLTDREQFLRANHYTNLQPLWYEDHKIKTRNDLKKVA
jgi:hypothetical protein